MKFSVIIPIYKAEAYLEKAVRSVLNQTYSDYEIILIDDGSPDKCPLMCDRYSAINPKIRTIHQQNAGVSIARNNGIKVAKGDIICFLDADDEWDMDFLKNVSMLYDLFPNIHASFTARFIRTPDGHLQLLQMPSKDKYFILDKLFGNVQYCRTSSLTVKKQLFHTLRPFREHVKRGEDLDLILRIFCNYKIGYCNIPLLIYNADTLFNSSSVSALSYFPYEEWYKYNYPNHRDLIIHTTGLIKDKIYKLLSEHYYRKAINLFLKGKWFSYLYHKLSVFFV